MQSQFERSVRRPSTCRYHGDGRTWVNADPEPERGARKVSDAEIGDSSEQV